MISIESASQDPRAASHSFDVPFALIARVIPPIKKADFKITLNIDQKLPAVSYFMFVYLSYSYLNYLKIL